MLNRLPLFQNSVHIIQVAEPTSNPFWLTSQTYRCRGTSKPGVQEKVRILYLFRDFWAGGGEPYEARYLVQEQLSQGIDVAVVHRARDGKRQYINILTNFERTENTFAIPSHDFKLTIGGVFSFLVFVKKFCPDLAIFVGYYIPLHDLWCLLVRLFKLPYMVFPVGLYTPLLLKGRWGGKRLSLVSKTGKMLYRAVFSRPLLYYASGIRAHSVYDAHLLEGKTKGRIFVVPHAVDRKWIFTDDERDKRGIGRPVRCVFVGRLDIWQKGLDILIDAIDRIDRAKHRNFTFQMAGPSVNDSVRILKQLCERKHITNVVFEGPVFGEKKTALLRQADFFLQVSRYESGPKAGREALGFGIPLIASFESNMGDWVVKHKMGYAVALDVNELCKVLVSILRVDNHEYGSMRRNARRFSELYSVEYVADCITKEMDNICLRYK